MADGRTGPGSGGEESRSGRPSWANETAASGHPTDTELADAGTAPAGWPSPSASYHQGPYQWAPGGSAGWSQPPVAGKALSILAIVLAVISLLFFPFGLVAVVLGVVAVVKKQRYAVAALIIAAVGLVGGVVVDPALSGAFSG